MRQLPPHYQQQTSIRKKRGNHLPGMPFPFYKHSLHRAICSISRSIQTLHQLMFRLRCCVQCMPAHHIIIRHHIVCFFHPFNKSFTNNIHPTLPTPAKNMKPIKIINLLGFAGFKGTVAGWTTVYTGVISCTLALAICNC